MGTDADAVQRTAGQVAGLSHENVAGLLDLETVEGRYAMAVEHSEAVSLQKLIAAAGSKGLEP
ncbi:MAG: hypothetical protein R3F14_47895, partial [Polyangiaceae bacterium]